MIRLRITVGRALLAGAALAVLLGVGGFLFSASGIYNVAADRGHAPPVRWFLHFTMRRSVATHSVGVKKPQISLDDADAVRLGAGHYHSGCATCHGGPGFAGLPVTNTMLPHPPDLADKVAQLSDKELFWIVKHGIKYTGMPSWPTLQRDDEVWIVVAFLRRLPELDAPSYRRLAFGGRNLPAASPDEIAKRGTPQEATSACARCHGDADTPPASDFVPRLGGQSAAYLISALRTFADGARPSGFMRTVAESLTQEQAESLAQYYSELAQPTRPPSEGKPDKLRFGERIAQVGVPEEGVPACDSCHGKERLVSYPQLDGQSRRYLVQQLRLWKHGGGHRAGQGAIMAPIAERLSADHIDAVASYYALLRNRAELEQGSP